MTDGLEPGRRFNHFLPRLLLAGDGVQPSTRQHTRTNRQASCGPSVSRRDSAAAKGSQPAGSEARSRVKGHLEKTHNDDGLVDLEKTHNDDGLVDAGGRWGGDGEEEKVTKGRPGSC